jgi:hypothetical protein
LNRREIATLAERRELFLSFRHGANP